MPSPPAEVTTDWDRSFQTYLSFISDQPDHSKALATLHLARRASSAPPHLLAAAIPVLVHLLDTSPASHLQSAAVYALLRIARRGPSLRSLIGQSAAIPPLVRLLPLSSADPSTPRSPSHRSLVARCLRALVAHDPRNCSILAQSGGLEAVLAAIPSSPTSARRPLFEILSTLAMLRESRRAIVGHDALPNLVEAISAGRLPYRIRAAHAVGFLASGRRIKHALVELGAIDALIGLMREGTAEAKIVAGNSLGILSSHPRHLELAVRAGAIALYSELLEGGEPLGQEVAEDAFCVFAVEKDNLVAICDRLARMLREGDERVKAAAADVVWDLSSYSCGVQVMRDCGAIGLLVDVLRRGSGESREKASGALAQMSYEKDARMSMAEFGAIPILIDMLGCDSDELRENATEALANFSVDPVFRERVSVVVDLPTFRSMRDRLIQSNEYMERSLRQRSIDQVTSGFELT